MELWIRSQDKRILQKVDNVYLNANYENRRICTNDSRDYESDLGEYKSKERALEVLDEIQRIIHPTLFLSGEISTDDNNWIENGIIYQKCTDNFSIQKLSTYVYEMSEE